MIVGTRDQLKRQRYLASVSGSTVLRLLLEELDLRRKIERHADAYCIDCNLCGSCTKVLGWRHILENALPFPDDEPVHLNRVLATAI